MPELPEVESVVVHLKKLLVGRSVVSSKILRPKLLAGASVRGFERSLKNTRINDIARRGKYILIGFDNDRTLIVHLRMSGRFFLLEPEADDTKFTHAVFLLNDGSRLIFDDQRHFGMMKIAATPEIRKTKELSRLAPEPFSAEFDHNYLEQHLSSSGRIIKEFLLDQTKVCGLGNIYAAEALFQAGISPATRANRLSPARSKKLHNSIVAVLQKAIATIPKKQIKGSAIGEGIYRSDGRWSVYGREGEDCFKCSAKIRRSVQAGRSSFYCPRCQK